MPYQAMQFTLRPLDTEKSGMPLKGIIVGLNASFHNANLSQTASYLLNVDGELFEKFVPFTAITLPKALRVFA